MTGTSTNIEMEHIKQFNLSTNLAQIGTTSNQTNQVFWSEVSCTKDIKKLVRKNRQHFHNQTTTLSPIIMGVENYIKSKDTN